jgi:hypothetical protein
MSNALLQETIHMGGFVASEAPGTLSREIVMLSASQSVVPGQVLGTVLGTVSPTSAAVSGNTGNGTMGTVTAVQPAQNGTYRVQYIGASKFLVFDTTGKLVCEGTNGTAFSGGGLTFTMTAGGTAFVAGDAFTISVPSADETTVVAAVAAFGCQGDGAIALASPAALAGVQIGEYLATCATVTVQGTSEGTFTVTDPYGNVVGTATIGTPFATQIGFTITDGEVPFAVGDIFNIDVSEAPVPGIRKPLNLTATDGSQIATDIAYAALTTDSSGSQPLVVVTRNAELIGNSLTWPSGITGPQMQTALDQLKSSGLIVR